MSTKAKSKKVPKKSSHLSSPSPQKYRLLAKGWAVEVTAHKLDASEVEQILSHSKEEGVPLDSLGNMEDVLEDYDCYSTNMWQSGCVPIAGKTSFVVVNEGGEELFEIPLESTKSPSTRKAKGTAFSATAKDGNVLVYTEESKGLSAVWDFQSPKAPKASDFAFRISTISVARESTPFVDDVLFNGKILERNYEDAEDLEGKAAYSSLILGGAKAQRVKRADAVKGKSTSNNDEAATPFPDFAPKTVEVGGQVWMAENLQVDRFSNGDPIHHAKTKSEWEKAGEEGTPAFCCYANKSANGATYGKLYNWYAVSDKRGLAPKGWHIPSKEEWDRLKELLGGQNTAGRKIKSESGWEKSEDGKSGNGTNETGFNALPAGQREWDGGFCDLGKTAAWWTASRIGKSAWFAVVRSANDRLWMIGYTKGSGYSVRCLRTTG
jgi:uncharacterized protein (TIGR02145 family)